MKNKGNILIELLAVISIFVVIITLFFGGVQSRSSVEDGDDMMEYVVPFFENTRPRQRMADEMQRQNDLLERQINIQEANQSPGRK